MGSMVTSEPDIKDSDRFNITQTARILGVSRQTISRCIREGVLHCSYRRVNRRPFVTGWDIKKYWKSEY